MFEGTEVVGGENALVGIVMGSGSDWPTMEHAARTLTELGVPYERHVISAHRTPDRCAAYAAQAQDRGIVSIIAAAGMAAHLPGVIAASTRVPVIGVPMQTSMMGGLDSLLSMVQMPKGIPVATMTIGNHGAINAAVYCARMLAPYYPDIAQRLDTYVEEMATKSQAQEPWKH